MKSVPFRLTSADAAAKLAQGGVLLFPTDTLVGLHCRADAAQAVRRIQSLKARETGRSLLLLAGEWDQVAFVAGSLSAAQSAYCRRCWPGPFTLILPAKVDLPGHLLNEQGTVAVRIPAETALRELIRRVGYPLVSTSANRTGEPPCTDLEQAEALFGRQVDGIWPGGQAGAGGGGTGQASALIDLSVWPPRLLRPGPLPVPVWDPAGGS